MVWGRKGREEGWLTLATIGELSRSATLTVSHRFQDIFFHSFQPSMTWQFASRSSQSVKGNGGSWNAEEGSGGFPLYDAPPKRPSRTYCLFSIGCYINTDASLELPNIGGEHWLPPLAWASGPPPLYCPHHFILPSGSQLPYQPDGMRARQRTL